MNVHLENGKRYGATIHLNFGEEMVESNADLEARFRALGFPDAKVVDKDGEHEGTGTWGGATGDTEFSDKHIKRVWPL